tara:strand:- start:162 stop:530 length:369 start_codon:yes stop_codon:yes gene_type:complete
MSEQNQIEEIKFNGKNLFKEESFTDLEVGTIRKLTPIHPDGTEDNDRKASFTATTNIMTPSGALPLNGEIEADSLEDAIAGFSEAVNKALQKLQDDMMKMQQEQANKIVTPDELRGGKDLII